MFGREKSLKTFVGTFLYKIVMDDTLTTDVTAFSDHWPPPKASVSRPDPENLKMTVWRCAFAATFPVSATVLNAGNAFFGTIQKFCTEEILPNFI